MLQDYSIQINVINEFGQKYSKSNPIIWPKLCNVDFCVWCSLCDLVCKQARTTSLYLDLCCVIRVAECLTAYLTNMLSHPTSVLHPIFASIRVSYWDTQQLCGCVWETALIPWCSHIHAFHCIFILWYTLHCISTVQLLDLDLAARGRICPSSLF